MTELFYVELSPSSGSGLTVPLGDTLVTLIPRYNYTLSLWSLDIFDAEGIVLVAGIMLIPNIDLLSPYPQIKRTLGSLVLIELNVGDHKSVDAIGINTKLLWYAPGQDVVLPV